MERNNMVIIALLVIIIALLVGLLAIMPTASRDTKLTFHENSTLVEGSSLLINLTDANGNGIANQTINISLSGVNKPHSYYVVKTDAEGVGALKLDKSAGNYNVAATYPGNDSYNGCNASKDITIEEKVARTQRLSSDSKSSQATQYDINNLPPSNDPYPETTRYFIDEYHVKQEYADGYMRTVDVRTGEIHSLGFK